MYEMKLVSMLWSLWILAFDNISLFYDNIQSQEPEIILVNLQQYTLLRYLTYFNQYTDYTICWQVDKSYNATCSLGTAVLIQGDNLLSVNGVGCVIVDRNTPRIQISQNLAH